MTRTDHAVERHGLHRAVDRPRPRPRWLVPASAALLVAGVLASVGVFVASSITSPVASPTAQVAAQPATASATATPQPLATTTAAPLVTFTDITGTTTSAVGGTGGMKPGLWQTEGGPACRWARNRTQAWSPDTGGHPTGRLRVWLRGDTTYFSSMHCGVWTWAGS